MNLIRISLITLACLIAGNAAAHAQTTTPATSNENDWKFTIYPVLAWIPTSIDIKAKVPPIEGGAGDSVQIVDGRFDGAFFGGVDVTNGVWRIESFGMWAAVGGDRLDLPSLVVDLDVRYADVKVGRRIAPDLYLSAGVRRLVFDYEVTLGDLPKLSRQPGIWDPIIGLGWHRIGPKLEWHARVDGGGFGVGADVDVSASARVDWKLLRVFGLTAGYNFLYLKVSDTVAGREIVVKPALHGPMVGIGFYF
jgi:hypothetical protein